MRLLKLQDDDKETKKLRSAKLLKSWENIEEMLHYQNFLYILKIFYLELISRHHNNFFTSYLDIEKTRKLIARKYYLLML